MLSVPFPAAAAAAVSCLHLLVHHPSGELSVGDCKFTRGTSLAADGCAGLDALLQWADLAPGIAWQHTCLHGGTFDHAAGLFYTVLAVALVSFNHA